MDNTRAGFSTLSPAFPTPEALAPDILSTRSPGGSPANELRRGHGRPSQNCCGRDTIALKCSSHDIPCRCQHPGLSAENSSNAWVKFRLGQVCFFVYANTSPKEFQPIRSHERLFLYPVSGSNLGSVSRSFHAWMSPCHWIFRCTRLLLEFNIQPRFVTSDSMLQFVNELWSMLVAQVSSGSALGPTRSKGQRTGFYASHRAVCT